MSACPLIRCRTLLAALVGVVACASHAQAQIGPIVSGPGGNPGIPPQVFRINEGPRSSEYNFQSPNNRAEVIYQTGAGAFEKWLVPDPDPNQDGVTDLNDFFALTQRPLRLNEYLTVGPGPEWTDWHETILTPGWEWNRAVIDTPNEPTSPTNLLITGTQTPTVEFFFDPLLPGTDVDIEKSLVFVGDPFSFTQQDVDDLRVGEFRIRIAEYPTHTIPEPAAAASCLLGLAALATRRRSRGA